MAKMYDTHCVPSTVLYAFTYIKSVLILSKEVGATVTPAFTDVKHVNPREVKWRADFHTARIWRN